MNSPTPPREEFRIGWICALPIEAAAAIQMLDENFGILQEQDSADTNSYTLGQIGKHYIVIACLPGGQYGTTSATTVAINMMRTFSKSLRIGLMVGIGGGIPSTDHDIRLGDIVVSCPAGHYGGVIQYDMGKVSNDGKLQRTGCLNSPPRSLLTALNNMRAAELGYEPCYPSYIRETIQRNARTRRNFNRPDPQSDRLFQIKHQHPASAATCIGCPTEWEEARSQREESDPQSHYGIIASGNAVIKHGGIREELRKETGALCFEMEAAGLMMDFPCIVIRGICDYADSHKNKQWQGYAALVAAAYAKELLSYLPQGHVSQERLVTDICTNIVEELQAINHSLEKALNQQESHHREQTVRALTEDQRRCHQAFKTSTYEQHKNINPNRVKGTCEWALKSPEYQRWWESSHNDLLWISADPGCGKSVLAKSFIDEVLNTSILTISVCYFFFKDNDEQNSLATALCAILHQLFGVQPQLLRHALPPWEKNQDKIQQEVDELWRILMAATSDPSSSYTICVLDALDESQSNDQKQLIQKLEHFYAQASPSNQRGWLKFFVTSRPYDEIQDGFRSITASFPHIHLRGEEENDLIHKEISLVVKIRVTELGKSLKLKPKTQEWLQKELLQMEHRTYLWLYLAIDDIRTMFQDSLRPDEESVQLIPRSVDAAYNKILDRVTPEQEPTVKTIFQIIIGARRPLMIQEMAMALGVATSTSARTAVEARVNSEGLGEKIRRLCGLFVFIKDSKIYLIHQTAREFLIDNNIHKTSNYKWRFGMADIESMMTQICIKYLLMDDLVDKPEKNHKIQSFLVYSAQNWPDHYREMPLLSKSELVELACRLYEVSSKQYGLWFSIFWKAVMPNIEEPKMSMIHLAAFNGHSDIISRSFTSNKSMVNHSDNTGRDALKWASLRGHYETVRILLENGADVNAQSGEYGNALYVASEGGHLEVVKILLERGADVNAQGGFYGNALQAASFRGHLEVVKILLERGAYVNAQGGEFGNAFHAASERGHLEVMKILLDKGADINAQGGLYGNALHGASFGGDLEVVKILLERGANVNAQGRLYGNALQAAISTGHLEVVKILLERGADVNAQHGFYGNALHVASWQGHLEVVEMLLERGADINTQGGFYDNALHAASIQGYPEVVKTLLERGADINAQHGEFGTALHAASSRGHPEVVEILLERGADINAQHGEYGNALHAASKRGHLEIIKILLERGVDINAQCREFGTALHAASFGGHPEVVKILLERGADINAQHGEFGNALHAASFEGHPEVAKILLERGVDINAQYGEFGNALHIASQGGHLEIIKILLERGADINAQCREFGTALHAASFGGHPEVVKILLERGADINAQYGEFGNALHAASFGGHIEVVKILLERGADVNTQCRFHGNALHAASFEGYPEVVKILLEKGADINAQGGRYGNALCDASFGGYLEVVEILLESGADVNAHCGEFGNALYAASFGGHPEVVEILLERGANINAQCGEYGNALHGASFGGHLEVVRILLERGADINAQCKEYGNALHIASSRGHLEVVKILLERGADVNAQGGEYGNALYAASSRGHIEVVKILLERGAYVNAQGGGLYGNALQAASFRGHLEVVRILLESGADVNAQGGSYGNALYAASERRHLEVEQVLLEKGAIKNSPSGS